MFRRVFAQTPIGTASLMAQPRRTFFGKGWDNASIEIVYRGVLRRANVQQSMQDMIATYGDSRALDRVRMKGDLAAKQGKLVSVFLAPHMGDPHRVLKAYALTAYPILDEAGHQVTISIQSTNVPCFADPDDDYSKVALPQIEMVKLLAEELLRTLSWEVSPRGAAALLEAIYRGAEIPDIVFESVKILDTIDVLAKEVVK